MNYEIENKSEYKKAEELVKEGLEKSFDRMPKEKSLVVEIEKIEDEFVRDNMNGVMGIPRGESKIEMQFDPRSDNWETHLPVMTAHEYAHTFYSEKWGQRLNDYKWRHVLQESHSQNFAKILYPEIEAPMRKHLSREEISDYWPEIRDEWLDKDSVGVGDPLFFGTGKFPNWLGYSIGYYIGQNLLEDHEIHEFPELEKEDVIEAGNELFD